MPVNQDAVDHTGRLDGYPAPARYEAPEEDKKLVTRLKAWLADAENARGPWFRQAELNRHYLIGDQLLARNRITGEIVRLNNEDSRRLKSQNNILRPTSRSLVGKLARMAPTYSVDPATTDFEEQHGARAGTAILQYVRQKENLDKVYSDLCESLPWAGNSFVQICWDRMAGRDVAFCFICNFFTADSEMADKPCPQCTMQREQEMQMQQQNAQMAMQDQQMAAAMGMPAPEAPPEVPPMGPLQAGQESPALVLVKEGDVKVKVRDPRNVMVPHGITDLCEADVICIRDRMSVAKAKALFPQFAAFIHEDAMAARNQNYRVNGSYGIQDEELADQVDVHEFHEIPTQAYPKGRVVVLVNDIVVEERESPYYKLGRVPLFHFGFDVIPGEFWRDAPITQAWHRQKELNLNETNLREHIELSLKPKLMNPIGSRISAEEFHSDSAQVINFAAAAGEPKWVPPPMLPQDAWARKSDLAQDVRLVFGVTESEQGMSQADPNGRALAIINAESDQQVGPIILRNNSEWKELHRAIIVLFQCYSHPERTASIIGPDGLQVYSFQALNLLQPGWDVRMEQEDGASRNPQIRQQQALELAAAGFFMDPMTGALDKKAFARYAKLRVPEAGYDQEATERAAASQIPYLLKKGGVWTPRSFDVPTIFMEELAGWLRGPGRREEPSLSQQVEQIWQYYTQWAMTGQMTDPNAQGGGAVPGGQASSPQAARTGAGGTPGNTGGIGTETVRQVNDADVASEDAAQAAAGE